MTTLFRLANELLILVASNLGQKDLRSLLQTSRRLAALLTPCFYEIALSDPVFKRQFSLETVLQWAVIEGHQTPIKQICERGGNMTVRNANGATLLHLAVENRHQGVVKLLLEKGADITAQNRSGATALHLAAEKGFDGLFILLQRVWRGPRFDKAIDMVDRAGCSPLHLAAANDCQEIVRILLDEGANIAVKNVRGRTPLHLAAEKGREATVRLLMEHGAAADAAAVFLDRAGNTPLHSAAKNGYEAVVRVLLEMGVDCTIATKFGATPLHWAAKMGHQAVVAALLENEAVVNATTQDENESTPLHWISESYCWSTMFKGRNPEPIVKLLLQNGADARIANANGKTALHYAAENGEYATRRKEERNTPGRSPKSSGASNTQNQVAIQEAHQRLIILLLDSGTDINARDHSGTTPLHCAAAYGDERTVRLLIERGAEIEAKNDAGKTPLEAGSEYPSTTEARNVIQALLDYGAQRTDQPEPEPTLLNLLDARRQRRISHIMAPANEKRKSWIADVGAQKLEKPELHFLKARVTELFGPAGFISRLVHWRRNKS